MKKFKNKEENKVVVVVTVFVILALSLTVMTYYGNKTITAARAYISGQGHWSKAQKDAVIYLIRYVLEENPVHFNQFDEALEVNRGDRAARITLSSDSPDYEIAREGFILGDNEPDDVEYLIWMFDNFQNISQVKHAVGIWERADQRIEELDRLGSQIHEVINNNTLTPERRAAYLEEIYKLDSVLTKDGKAFAEAMNKTARATNNFVFWLTIVLGLGLIFTGGTVSFSYLRRVESWNKKLQNSEEKLRNVLKNSRDVVYKFNLAKGEYEYMSTSVEAMLGYDVEEVLEGGIDFIIERMHPDDAKKMSEVRDDFIARDVEKYYNSDAEFRVKTKEGNYIWVSNLRSFIFDDEGNPRAIVGCVRDISQRKRNEKQLDRSLREKDVLLAEIHHRVKNNLAVISGLLILQADRSPEGKITKALRDSQNRIHSIAEVHELLYQTQNFSEIDLESYLDKLFSRITRTHNLKIDISYNLDVNNTGLSLVQAVPFGLLMNELVTNSLKHAFHGCNKGTISLKIREENEFFKVIYKDDGIGLNPGIFDGGENKTLGVQLIKTLIKQLQADYKIHKLEKGFKLSLQFKNAPVGNTLITHQ